MALLVKKLTKSKQDTIEIISTFTIEELEEIITYAADKYYNSNKPVISDSMYDILIDFLQSKAPKSKVLKNVGAKVKTKNKVKLDYWLGSMDKIKPPSKQLENWMKKYSYPYNLSDKLDGISTLITYNNNSIKMYTRGTATEGTDITNLVKYMEQNGSLIKYDIVEEYCKKHKIKGEKNMIAFRGELIIKESVFQEEFSDKLKNGRNSVAGLVNSKTVNPDLANATDLVLYEVVDPFYPIEKQLDIIKMIGFKTVYNKTISSNMSYEYLSSYLKSRKEKSDYIIDGIIISSCDKQERNIDGNPEYAFAFKDVFEDMIVQTTIESIEWTASKDGYMKPVLLVTPVTIGGVVIKRVTGNNAKFIVDNMLGTGATIEIIRSGDVIPKVHKVIKKATKSDLPKGKWHWNETKVDILLDSPEDNNTVLVKNIYYFFSSMDTKGLGEKNVEKMVYSGLDSIKKIIEATYDDLIKVEGFKDKTANNILMAIKKALTNVPLTKLMAASNKLGHGMGEERMKQILLVYPNLLTDYKKWTEEEFINKLKELNGWEEKTSTLFVNNFGDFIKFYDSIKKHVILETTKITSTTKGTFTGKTVVFSSFRDAVLQKQIEDMGGKISTSVSKNTDYLIVKNNISLEEPSEKIKKAIELKITILTKDKLIKLL